MSFVGINDVTGTDSGRYVCDYRVTYGTAQLVATVAQQNATAPPVDDNGPCRTLASVRDTAADAAFNAALFALSGLWTVKSLCIETNGLDIWLAILASIGTLNTVVSLLVMQLWKPKKA